MKEFIKNKKALIIILSLVIVLLLAVGGYFLLRDNEEGVSDPLKFKEEYTFVSDDNVFVYKTVDEIYKILEHGTGVVYLGFPECPWCQEYVKYVDEVSKEVGLDKIYYYNVLKIRSANDKVNKGEEVTEEEKSMSKDYEKLVNLIGDHLTYNDEGDKRIFVPTVLVIDKGEIIMFDDETAFDTKGYETPQEYWENEDLAGLKSKLSENFAKVKKNICTTNCNK